MHLNNARQKQLAIAVLILLSTRYAGAEVETATCNSTISANCSCAMPILERELGIDDTKFLIEIWQQAYSKQLAPSDDFFRRHAERILPISFRYGLIKYFVAAQCGGLAFEDGNE